MPQATTKFPTENADRYLAQLVKHFGHKIPAEQTGRTGRCDFPVGTATMAADESGLAIDFTAEDSENLENGKMIVEDHLLRFAFREEPAPLVWTPIG